MRAYPHGHRPRLSVSGPVLVAHLRADRNALIAAGAIAANLLAAQTQARSRIDCAKWKKFDGSYFFLTLTSRG